MSTVNCARSLALVLIATLLVASPSAGRALAQEPEFPPCRIKGVLVDASGQPRDGVQLHFMGGGSSGGPGLPPWTRPEPVTTSADGAFLFSFEQPGGLFWIAVDDERFEAARWHFLGVGDGEQIDLGKLRLADATLLQVSLVDANGGLLTDGWHVMIQPDDRHSRFKRLHVNGAVDPRTGVASFPRAWVGPCNILASGPRGRWVHHKVVLSAEDQQMVELVIPGPRMSELLVVTPEFVDNRWLPREEGILVAVGPDGEERPLARSPEYVSHWLVQLPLDEVWRLASADPRFALEGDVPVRAGQDITVRLRGTSALTLDVRDLRSDGPIESYRLEEHRASASRVVRLAGAPLPEGGRYDGFVAGDFDLALFVEGRSARSLKISALAPGETRTLRVLFGAGQTLLGRVVDAEGQPLTGGKVRVAAYVAEGLRPRSRKGSQRSDDRERREVALAPDGSFELQGLACGTFDVSIELPDGRRAAAIVDVPQTGPLELRPMLSEPPPPAPQTPPTEGGGK